MRGENKIDLRPQHNEMWEPLTHLQDIEMVLHSISVDLWCLTVDDPETATRASEEAETDPRRLAIREFFLVLSELVGGLENFQQDRPYIMPGLSNEDPLGSPVSAWASRNTTKGAK